MLVHHTDCGMVTFSDEQFRQGIEEETGIRPSWSSEASFLPRIWIMHRHVTMGRRLELTHSRETTSFIALVHAAK